MKGRLRRWLVPDPIRRQYTFKFGIVLLLLGTTIGTIGLVATGEIRQEISTDVEAEYANLAAREARNLENWHRNNRRTARSMANAGDVRTGDSDQVRAYLQRQQLEGSGTVTEIHYVNLDDRQVVASTEGRLEGREFGAVDRPWANVSSVGNREVITTEAYRKGTAGAVLAYVTGVERPGGEDGMALVVTVRTAAYSQTVVDSADTHTAVVDTSGRIVFAQQYQTLIQYYDDGPAPPVERAREPGSTGGGSMRIPAPDSVRTALSLADDEEVIVGYDRVDDTGWVVLVHAPAETAFGFVDWITFVGFGATLATLLLVTGVGLVMGRDTARGIDRLTEKAAQLEAGNYDVDLSTERIDNLGRLYAAFDSMASSLADRERTLRSQTEVLESERDRLSALFDNATDPVVRLTLEGGNRVIRDANARFDRTFAPDADTPVSGPIDEAVEVPDGERSLSSLIREAPGEGVEREVVAIAGEETREFLFRWIPIGTDGGREGYAVFTDITDRKERERDLKRNETVIEALGDPVYALDPEGTITFVNEAVLEATGYAESELVGNDYSMVMDEDDAERAANLVVELLESNDRSTATIEWDLRTADGDVIPVENHIALLEEDGRFQGTAGVLRDVTDRKEREKQLRRSEERYRTLVENSPAPIGIVTPGPTLSYANGAGIQFLGADSEASVVDSDPLQFVHPDGRELARERLLSVLEDRTVAEPIEQQFVALDGTERVATITSAPITYEDEPAVMIVLNDVTERKRHERALRSLNDAARRLLNTETEEGIAEVVADAAEAAIDVDGCAVYLLDADENRLEPVGITPGFVEVTGGTPSVTVGDGDSAVWEAYLDGERVTVEDDEGTGRLPGDARAGQFLPLGDHGVFAAVCSSDEPFDEDTDRLVELLAATTEAAFDRLESEASLRDREAQLEQQNERLERQVQINRTIRDVQKKLTSASTREEVERGACEGLTDLQGFRFAWIGEQDPTDERPAPRVWAGEGQSYLDEVIVGEADGTEPAWRTARAGETTLVGNVVEDVHDEPWRKAAVAHGFNSVISVPLSYQDYTYGVLTVYAEKPDAFGSLERAVFEELAVTIADGINAVETKQALYDDRALELKLAVEPGDSLLGRIAHESGGEVTFDGIAGSGGETTRLFFSVADTDPAAVTAVLEDAVAVTDSRVIRETDDETVFEATVEAPTFVGTLVDHGGRIRSAVADGGGTEYVVDLPRDTDVREFVDMLRDRYPSTELVARRDVERSLGSTDDLVESVLGELTDRQREVLTTAYFGGFFEWPRESTGEDVAEMLNVSQPTVNRHLRLAQRAILSQLIGESVPDPATAED